MKFEDFSGYILAGGKSSRMGKDKAFLKFGKKTFLENAFEILKPVCENRIKIVLNPNQNNFIEKLPENIPYIFDVYENRGPLGGIHSALTDCKTKWAIILAIDLPYVTTKIIKKLAETALNSDKVSAVVPKLNNGKLQTLCAVYKADNLSIIRIILSESSSASVHKLLQEIKSEILDLQESDKKNILFANINTFEEFESIVNKSNGKS